MTGLTTNGQILTGSSSRELIASTAVRIDSPGPVHQGLPVSEQGTHDLLVRNVIEVSATGLPDGPSISPSGLITGTTYEAGTFRTIYTAKGFPYSAPPYHSPISTTVIIDMAVALWGVEIPASAMTDGFFLQDYSWQLPIQHVNGETVNGAATGLPEGLSISPTGLVSGYPRHDVHHHVTCAVTARPISRLG